jgi:hypothetical protein
LQNAYPEVPRPLGAAATKAKPAQSEIVPFCGSIDNLQHKKQHLYLFVETLFLHGIDLAKFMSEGWHGVRSIPMQMQSDDSHFETFFEVCFAELLVGKFHVKVGQTGK